MSGTAMTEFRITSDLTALRQQAIEANFDEVRGWLDENLQPYRSMVVTEDMISEAKTYRVSIRKVKDRIDQSRKEAKSAALAGYMAFETKCKELTGLCDEAAGALDRQVKAFEERERTDKLGALRKVYDEEAVGEIADYCPWERVFVERWLNKSYNFDAAAAEISVALERTKSDLEAIREIGGDDTAYLLDVYKRVPDMSAVVRKASELKTARRREAEARRAAEANAARRAEVVAPYEEKPGAEEAYPSSAAAAAPSPQGEGREDPSSDPAGHLSLKGKADPSVTPQSGATAPLSGEPESEAEEILRVVDFRVWCTPGQLSELGAFMKSRGIRYGRVPRYE